MKHIIYLAFAIIILSTCTIQDKPPDLRYSFTEIIDASHTPPNTYEIHYRTTLSNGLIIDRWTDVDREEYERSVEK